MTDGRKLKKSKDENYQEIAAQFDGKRLSRTKKTLAAERRAARSNSLLMAGNCTKRCT